MAYHNWSSTTQASELPPRRTPEESSGSPVSPETRSIFSISEISSVPTSTTSFSTGSDTPDASNMVKTPLSDVPEHGPFTPTTPDSALPPVHLNHHSPNSPYFAGGSLSSNASSTTLGGSGREVKSNSSRKSSSSRKTGSSSSSSNSRRSAADASSTSRTTSLRRSTSTSTLTASRSTPRLAHLHEKDVPIASSTIMYWSRAPVYGACPTRTMRGHTVTLVDSTAWVFGGCDDKETARDIYCFDVETMQWSHPTTTGDLPPPSRAHTATLVDRKIYVFGGGQSASYSDAVYILDTVTRTWTKPAVSGVIRDPNTGQVTGSAPSPPSSNGNSNNNGTNSSSSSVSSGIYGEAPAPRRAHTAVHYNGRIWVFGGGNGMMALNDVWTLDVSKMVWERMNVRGRDSALNLEDHHYGGRGGRNPYGLGGIPSPRGYHTANLVGNMMIVVGGSDGKDCFAEIWCLNLDTLEWTLLDLPESHKRLSHTSTQVGSYLFIQGGHNGGEYINDIRFFNLVNLQYEPRPTAGLPPSPRGYHSAILADSRLWVFGGYNGSQAYDDVFIADLAGGSYLPQVTSFSVEV
ncbi:galactose oxidase [Lentinula aff. detonsa]|uniref:Galactose oxidase n=1 Tax=Lentinula aff. detonsa TaxID=2804958 RepID=A0AA38NT48_9AGAR|nr:galactose oxidase [Lentinula aff. detonsa]KAJ3802695.1 galactose oxidase [Lentinula aff. detonsa]